MFQRENMILKESDLNAQNTETRTTKNFRKSIHQSSQFDYENIAEKAVDLIFNNKINSKNAFDVNVSFLEQLPNLIDQKEETSWQKASVSLDASAKIYGYRVDSVHTETFKFLGGLNRTHLKNDDENLSENNKKIKKSQLKADSTIEKDIKKLDVQDEERIGIPVDPLFNNLVSSLKEDGAKNLLLKNFPLDSGLNLMFESNIEGFDREITHENPDDVQIHLISSIVKDWVQNINFNELYKMEIFPDLEVFKESTQIDLSIVDNSLLNHLIMNDTILLNNNEEIENGDFLQNIEIEEENMNIGNTQNIIDENEMKNDYPFSDITLMNLSRKEQEKNYFEKKEEFRNLALYFGDGNIEVINKFQEFSKKFENQDKGKFSVNSLKNETKEKKTKVEKLFNFGIDIEVNNSDVFKTSEKSKIPPILTETKKKVRYGKLKEYYYYDKLNLFQLHTINNTLSAPQNSFVKTYANNLQNENPNFPKNHEIEMNNSIISQSMHEQVNALNLNENEKKIRKLYRTFDVGLVKKKMWESLSETPNSSSSFNSLIKNLSDKLDDDVKDNISSSTCFVCLLHLANEKQLDLEQYDNDFTIKQNQIALR